MLITAYQYALYKNKQKKFGPEFYDEPRGFWSPMTVIFFIIELFFMFIAIQMALISSVSNKDLVVRLMLAIFFSIPYVFLNVLYSDRGEQYKLWSISPI